MKAATAAAVVPSGCGGKKAGGVALQTAVSDLPQHRRLLAVPGTVLAADGGGGSKPAVILDGGTCCRRRRRGLLLARTAEGFTLYGRCADWLIDEAGERVGALRHARDG